MKTGLTEYERIQWAMLLHEVANELSPDPAPRRAMKLAYDMIMRGDKSHVWTTEEKNLNRQWLRHLFMED